MHFSLPQLVVLLSLTSSLSTRQLETVELQTQLSRLVQNLKKYLVIRMSTIIC